MTDNGDMALIEPRSSVALMTGYHSPQVDVAVRLNTNESPYAPPDAFMAAYEKALGSLKWNRYPDRQAKQLREAIAAHHDVNPEQVFVANGSNEVLQTLLLTYGGPGRKAAVFEPTYALHTHLARITGTDVIAGSRDDDFFVVPAEYEALIAQHGPDIVFWCSPNNPTGRVERRDVIEQSALNDDHLSVVDEAYGQFADRSAMDLLAEDRALVVTRTFSKTWAMAGARLGYLIGPTWLVNELNKVVLPYHLDAAKQLAGQIALQFDHEMEQRVATLREERGRLVTGLQALDVDVVPSDANFVLFRPRGVDADVVWQRLVDASVLVRNCASWPGLQGCLRVTVGTEEEDTRFLDALKEALDE